MLTTKEAAELLGVSPRRVLALIKSGDLAAQKVGSQWLVDRASAKRRAQSPKHSGRPKLGQKDLLALRTHTLMCQNRPVLDFTYDVKQKRARIDCVHDPRFAPFGLGEKPNGLDLSRWIEHRCMPPLRPEYLRAAAAQNAGSPEELMFGSLGLNLSDQYWFRPLGESLTWEDVNFFQNDYAAGPRHRTPNSSTPGALEKRWVKRGDVSFLLKASSSTDEREPFNELLATKLLSRLLAPGDFVPYTLEQHDGRWFSACPTFVSPQTEFVAANDVVAYAKITDGRDLYRSLVRFGQERGISSIRADLSKMIIVDHIMANFDRHRANFGFVCTTATRDDWRLAPLFDNGAGFFSRATLPELRRAKFSWQSAPFEEWPLLQLARAEDPSWYEPDLLANFPEEVVETLSRNPNLPEEFAHLAAGHVQRQIQDVNRIYEERVVYL
ncbi:MAG: DNA-binding protein [Coriobacteriia bacterium]|nr:DNA-binding protein [Coriobacteriia bacterium]